MEKNNKILNGYCVAGLILGILSFVSSFINSFNLVILHFFNVTNPYFFWHMFILSMSPLSRIIAIILSIVGLLTIKKHPKYTGKNLGIVGLILSSLGIIIWILPLFLRFILPTD